MDDKGYLVKRDGRTKAGRDVPWLLGYCPSGIYETKDDGTVSEVYTCLWSDSRHGALLFRNEAQAKLVAQSIGGCVVITVTRSETR